MRIGCYDSDSHIISNTGHYDIQAEQDGTRLKEVVRFQAKGIFKLMESMLSGQFQGNYDEQMRKLKQLLEANFPMVADIHPQPVVRLKSADDV